MKAIFEVEKDGSSIVIWEAGSGTRIIFPSEDLAAKQAEIVQSVERRFHKSKESCGVAVLECFGELMTPFEYVRRLLKAYKCGVGKYLGIIVQDGILERPPEEFW